MDTSNEDIYKPKYVSEAQKLMAKLLNLLRKFGGAAEAKLSGLYISPEPKVLEECQLKSK